MSLGIVWVNSYLKKWYNIKLILYNTIYNGGKKSLININLNAINKILNINSKLNIIKKNILRNFRHNPNYVRGDNDNNKNTVILIEPRFIQHSLLVLANTYNKLGNNRRLKC